MESSNRKCTPVQPPAGFVARRENASGRDPRVAKPHAAGAESFEIEEVALGVHGRPGVPQPPVRVVRVCVIALGGQPR